MTETIFQKLIKRIEKKKFNRFTIREFGYLYYGILLSKKDWKRYQRAIPKIVQDGYEDKIMWFRGYPLKQRND